MTRETNKLRARMIERVEDGFVQEVVGVIAGQLAPRIDCYPGLACSIFIQMICTSASRLLRI